MSKPRRIPVIREDGTILIPLNLGYVTIVDWEDVWVCGRGWSARLSEDGVPYVYSADGKSLHREILGLRVKDGLIGDHINGDTLNNRRDNLRAVTPAGNSRNIKMNIKNTSGYPGVSWHKRDRHWRAQLNKKYIGAFQTPEEANIARLKAEQKYWGEQPRRDYSYIDVQNLKIKKLDG